MFVSPLSPDSHHTLLVPCLPEDGSHCTYVSGRRGSHGGCAAEAGSLCSTPSSLVFARHTDLLASAQAHFHGAGSAACSWNACTGLLCVVAGDGPGGHGTADGPGADEGAQ